MKNNKELGVRYMQEWEEKENERREARAEGLEQGVAQGINNRK